MSAWGEVQALAVASGSGSVEPPELQLEPAWLDPPGFEPKRGPALVPPVPVLFERRLVHVPVALWPASRPQTA